MDVWRRYRGRITLAGILLIVGGVNDVWSIAERLGFISLPELPVPLLLEIIQALAVPVGVAIIVQVAWRSRRTDVHGEPAAASASSVHETPVGQVQVKDVTPAPKQGTAISSRSGVKPTNLEGIPENSRAKLMMEFRIERADLIREGHRLRDGLWGLTEAQARSDVEERRWTTRVADWEGKVDAHRKQWWSGESAILAVVALANVVVPGQRGPVPPPRWRVLLVEQVEKWLAWLDAHGEGKSS